MLIDDVLCEKRVAAKAKRVPSKNNMKIVSVKGPSLATDGVRDVVTLRGLLRAVVDLTRGSESQSNNFARALAKTLNANGALAEAILEDARLYDKRRNY